MLKPSEITCKHAFTTPQYQNIPFVTTNQRQTPSKHDKTTDKHEKYLVI